MKDTSFAKKNYKLNLYLYLWGCNMYKENENTTTVSLLFLFLSVLFITCLLLSNILAAKLLRIGEWSVTAGVLGFPISYILNDIMTEVYGFKLAKKVIYIGFLMNFFMVLIFSLAIVLPAPTWYEMSDEFAMIIGSTPRIIIAGLAAYLSGSLVNARVMSRMKIKSNDGRKFGLRAIVSTLVGETIDSGVFVPIAFGGLISVGQILNMMMVQVILKTLYECICLPLTAVIVRRVREHEEKDHI